MAHTTPLFSKLPKGYELTEAGHGLLTHVDAAQSSFSTELWGLRGDGEGLMGQIRIGAPDGCANFFSAAGLRVNHQVLSRVRYLDRGVATGVQPDAARSRHGHRCEPTDSGAFDRPKNCRLSSVFGGVSGALRKI